MKSLHDTSRRTVQVDKAYSGSSRVRDGSYETDSRQRGFYENATQYTATVTARRAQSVVEHRLVVDKEGFSEVAQRVEIPLGVGRKSGKTDREISKSVTRALMMRMIAYVACAPHARRKDTRT